MQGVPIQHVHLHDLRQTHSVDPPLALPTSPLGTPTVSIVSLICYERCRSQLTLTNLQRRHDVLPPSRAEAS